MPSKEGSRSRCSHHQLRLWLEESTQHSKGISPEHPLETESSMNVDDHGRQRKLQRGNDHIFSSCPIPVSHRSIIPTLERGEMHGQEGMESLVLEPARMCRNAFFHHMGHFNIALNKVYRCINLDLWHTASYIPHTGSAMNVLKLAWMSSLLCVFFFRKHGKTGQAKEDFHLSFSNKGSCASLWEGSISIYCCQGRIGSPDRNSRTSNPGKFSTSGLNLASPTREEC